MLSASSLDYMSMIPSSFVFVKEVLVPNSLEFGCVGAFAYMFRYKEYGLVSVESAPLTSNQAKISVPTERSNLWMHTRSLEPAI